MELSLNNREILLDGLNASMRDLERKIKKINSRTEADYVDDFASMDRNHMKRMTLDELKKDDTLDYEDRIKEIKNLYNQVATTQNQILFVPHTIQLHLHAEKR